MSRLTGFCHPRQFTSPTRSGCNAGFELRIRVSIICWRNEASLYRGAHPPWISQLGTHFATCIRSDRPRLRVPEDDEHPISTDQGQPFQLIVGGIRATSCGPIYSGISGVIWGLFGHSPLFVDRRCLGFPVHPPGGTSNTREHDECRDDIERGRCRASARRAPAPCSFSGSAARAGHHATCFGRCSPRWISSGSRNSLMAAS
jgi:hypothetical protein